MKKFVTAFALALAIGALSFDSATAQTIGFKVGPTFSNIDEDPDDATVDEGTLTSFGGGGFIRFGFAGLSLQLEALAITKGSKVQDETSDDNLELQLDYIEVPITAMFSLGNGPYLFAGPSFGFEIGCDINVEFAGSETSFDCDEDSTESFSRKKLDVGVTGGLGFQFPLGPGSLLVEGRYTHGLTNLNDEPNSEGKIRNRSYAAFAGYAIPIGSR